ncbi:hypothetical protein ACFZBU_01840 [Embleya sp. NPDC008237]|uniref:hypothetical protein n=1 Tax=Embleya sp. NPDC008237 TaxID=3363978 RepID=UPI0036E688AC
MPRGPSAKEITAFLRDVRDHKPGTDPAALAADKADLFERIAAAHPEDKKAADVAKSARTAADRARGR